MTPTAPVYLHIGLQKTGTSFLQDIVWASAAALLEQDLELIPRSRRGMFDLALDVRERYREQVDDPTVAESLTRFAADLAQTEHRVLVSQEALSAASPPQIERLFAALGHREVHVVITARDPGRVIPAAWQQHIRQGRSYTMAEYVAGLHQAPARTTITWRIIDLGGVVQRWAVHVPPERLHVVTVPQRGADPLLLLQRFCRAIDLDPERLDTDIKGGKNQGLRAEPAEVLRRINAGVEPTFQRRDVYAHVVKRGFTAHVLAGLDGSRIQLPATEFEWCHELAEDFVATIENTGCDVIGDLGDLLPQRSEFDSIGTGLSEDAVSEVAVAALTTILNQRMDARLAEVTAGRVATLRPRVLSRLGRWLRRQPD